MAAWDEMAVVGRITRPHGLRGDVVISPETDFVDERFVPGATLWMRAADGTHTLKIATARVHGGRAIVGFEGCTRIEDAERLGGLELRVPEETLQPLGAHTYYQHQLVGCAVEDTTGAQVGEVERVDGGTGGRVLVVHGERGEVLIPLTQAICTEIDIAAKRIRIDPPEGLLDLNEVRHRHDLPADGTGGARGRRRQPRH